MGITKSFSISKHVVWNAYKQVRANRGSAGIDKQSLNDFEKDLKRNLYKIWNRMSSGSYYPPPVKQVGIPKKDGGTRYLGIPTVADRVAQMVVKTYLEPQWDALFHPNSFGYRPGKSALDAIAVTRRRCWKYNWVVEFDIRGAFDNIDHELLMKAVRKHTTEKWQVLYIERWLTAPFITPDGETVTRTKGTPQGGVVSPLLMNLFMHYVFDAWMSRTFPCLPFARYADDAVIHCRTLTQAKRVMEMLDSRLQECHLNIHPEKSSIVYCKDTRRKVNSKVVQFTFLGYTFSPRNAVNNKGEYFTSFVPAVSKAAMKKMKATVRSWKLHRRTSISLEALLKSINRVFKGWYNYYGKFRPSDFREISDYINRKLMHWARRKYKPLKSRLIASYEWLKRISEENRNLCVCWRYYGIPNVRW